MGSVSGGDYVKSGGIERNEFLAQLKKNGYKTEKIDEALSIFDRCAGDDKLLDEQEQLAAKAEFDELDADDNNEVSKKEFKKGGISQSYKAYKAFMETLDNVAQADTNKGVIVPDVAEENQYSVVKGAGTPTTDDDDVKNYQAKNGKITPTTPEEPEENSKPQPAEFKDTEEAGLAVYKYLLDDENIDKSLLDDLFKQRKATGFGDNAKTWVAKTKDDKSLYFVIYNEKYYQIVKNEEGKIEILEDSAENYTISGDVINYEPKKVPENPKNLKEVLIESETTDTKHNYLNKHGKAGNTKSTYSNGEIANTSVQRQHVNPVQTFTSMLLNNNEESSLKFNHVLQGKDVIDVILAGQERNEHKDEISLSDLIKYLNAAVKEAKETTDKKMNIGSRTAAGDVDMDFKDMANIGIIFKKYAGEDGYLNASELDKLIKDLTTTGNNTTKIAKDAYRKENPEKPEQEQPVKPEPAPQNVPHTGRALEANRTRNIAGTKKEEQVTYHYENGLRTIVDNKKAVLDENIAEYTNHGFLGSGRKDFVKIKGLPANVRAEIVNGKLKQDMLVKVKDASGNITYYNVTYNTTDKTYALGEAVTKKGVKTESPETALLKSLFGSDNNMNIPPGLTAKKHKGKTVYMLKGREIKEDVARAHVIAYNAKRS